jgi:hypothetical protein
MQNTQLNTQTLAASGAFAVELHLKRTRMGKIVVSSRGKWPECRVVDWWFQLAGDRTPGGGALFTLPFLS